MALAPVESDNLLLDACVILNSPLTLCLLGKLHAFVSHAECFQIQHFRKFISGIRSECHIVFFQIRPLNRLQISSADDNSSQRVMSEEKYSIDVQGKYLLPLHGDTIACN